MTSPADSDLSVTTTSQQPPRSLNPPVQLPVILTGDCQAERSWWTVLLQNWQRSGIVLLLCSSGMTFAPVAIKNLHQVGTPQPIQQVFTRMDYELLKMGMTVSDAQANLGRAIEEQRDEMTVTYKWVNRDGSGIKAVFKSNRLVGKQQEGLK